MDKIRICFLFCIIALNVAHAQKIALKNNIFWDATGTVNLGMEYAFTKKLSAELTVNYNGWALNDPQMYKHTLLKPEIRYWFREAFNEHFVGVHFVYGNFNIERMSLPMFGFQRKYLYKEGMAYGGGASYGYNIYLSPRMNLELSLGMGYLVLKYKKYEYDKYPPADDAPEHPFLARSYIGPTQIGVTFVYLLK
jgi:long-subunit fatty acid transport protein